MPSQPFLLPLRDRGTWLPNLEPVEVADTLKRGCRFGQERKRPNAKAKVMCAADLTEPQGRL